MGCALSRLKTKASTTYLKPQKIVRTHQECKADDLTGNPTNFPAEKAWWCCRIMEARQERRHRCQTVSLSWCIWHMGGRVSALSTVQQQKSNKRCQYNNSQGNYKAVRPIFFVLYCLLLCFLTASIIASMVFQWSSNGLPIGLPMVFQLVFQWPSSGLPVAFQWFSSGGCGL